jgi:hypothetical protein
MPRAALFIRDPFKRPDSAPEPAGSSGAKTTKERSELAAYPLGQFGVERLKPMTPAHALLVPARAGYDDGPGGVLAAPGAADCRIDFKSRRDRIGLLFG